MSDVVTRFAPSPTGFLHLGNARTALFSWLAARKSGGRFIVRVEDTDAERSREEYVQALLEDLSWLGLDWDEGPTPGGGELGECGPYRQSARAERYAQMFDGLLAADAAYPCFCTAEELERSRRAQRLAGRPPRYAGTCARLSPEERAARVSEGRSATLRFRVPASDDASFVDRLRDEQRFNAADIGDFVIQRSDGSAAFFFANAVDDADQRVTLVLRGEDHLTNTPRQRMILQALNKRLPDYGHLPLILGDDGAPLSKRNGSVSLRDLRADGFLPEAVVAHLARLGHRYESDGWLDREALIEGFDLERIGRSAARHDPVQLLHWQSEAVRHSSPARLQAAWFQHPNLVDLTPDQQLSVLSVLRDNVVRPSDLAEHAALIDVHWMIDADAREQVDQLLADDRTTFFAAIETALKATETEPVTSPEQGAKLVAMVKSVSGLNGKRLFMPLRLLLTGQQHGPELPRVIAHLAQWLGPTGLARRLRDPDSN
ncbi:MAG: glutamate--tRNA ligase [Thioalkalivibrionaceae bacterium]